GLEEPSGEHGRRRIQIGGEGGHGLLVRHQEQPLLAPEVLEDGALGDRELGGDVLDAGGVVAALREVAHGGLENASALGLRAGAARDGRCGDGGTGLDVFHDCWSSYKVAQSIATPCYFSRV